MRVRENLELCLALLLATACSKGPPEKRAVGSPSPGAEAHFALVGGTSGGLGSAVVTFNGAAIEAIAAFASRAVVSTLATFGGTDALANLGALRGSGATVLYGTDLGNFATPAFSRPRSSS